MNDLNYNTEYEHPTPSDGEDAVLYQLPSAVREAIQNFKILSPNVANVMQDIAINSYMKGKSDGYADTLNTLARKPVESEVF